LKINPEVYAENIFGHLAEQLHDFRQLLVVRIDQVAMGALHALQDAGVHTLDEFL